MTSDDVSESESPEADEGSSPIGKRIVKSLREFTEDLEKENARWTPKGTEAVLIAETPARMQAVFDGIEGAYQSVQEFGKNGGGFDNLIRLTKDLKLSVAILFKATAERDSLRSWIEKLQKGNTLTCVYCGHEYPPGNPTHGTKVLTEHVKQCPKHPMAELTKENLKLRQTLAQVPGRIVIEAKERAGYGNEIELTGEDSEDCPIIEPHLVPCPWCEGKIPFVSNERVFSCPLCEMSAPAKIWEGLNLRLQKGAEAEKLIVAYAVARVDSEAYPETKPTFDDADSAVFNKGLELKRKQKPS